MLQLAFLLLGQGGDNTAEPPDSGIGLGIIAAVLAAIIIGGFLLHLLIAKRSKASKGGVEPPRFEKDAETHPSKPPLESIEPRS